LGKRLWEEKQRARVHGKFMETLRDLLYEEAIKRLRENGLWEKLMRSLGERSLDPYSAAEEAMAHVLRPD
jgi:hypothetical protein